MFRNPVMVLGDVMLDRHVHGHVRRISPEAPVPVVAWCGRTTRPVGRAMSRPRWQGWAAQ